MTGAPVEAPWRAARGLVPVATLLLGVLLAAVPYGAPGLPAVMPALGLCGVYFWTLHRPRLVPSGAVFLIGLFQDALLGGPLGLSALTLLLVQAFIANQRRFLHDKSFALTWFGFAIAAPGAFALAWLVACVYFLTPLPLGPVAVQAGMTIGFYPVVAWLLAHLHRHLFPLGAHS